MRKKSTPFYTKKAPSKPLRAFLMILQPEKTRFSVLYKTSFFSEISGMLGNLNILGKTCQSYNSGYLTHLYAIRVDMLTYVWSPSQTSLVQPTGCIGLKADSKINEFVLNHKTATLTESMSESGDGAIFSMQIAISLKGITGELVNWMYLNAHHRFVLLLRDTLGNCYMAGSFENGVKIGWVRQLVAQSLQQISFSLVNWHPIQFIPTVDLNTLMPQKLFDHSFDLSFS
jgi:hypothetical protein